MYASVVADLELREALSHAVHGGRHGRDDLSRSSDGVLASTSTETSIDEMLEHNSASPRARLSEAEHKAAERLTDESSVLRIPPTSMYSARAYNRAVRT